MNVTKPNAPLIAHDVESRIIALEWVADFHGQQQRPCQIMPMVSGLVLLKRKRIEVELAHILVLDGDFPQKGMIAIFIVTWIFGGTTVLIST